MKTISVKIPDQLNAILDQVSQRKNMAKSEVVRVALEEYLKRPIEKTHKSCADLAGDLIGCLSGQKDKATSRRHMQGYGR